MQRLLIVVVSLLVLASPADALVMCGQKKPDGTPREGASIKLRSACKPQEVRIDPVALGLEGPAGPPGSGVVARDATGRVIGQVTRVAAAGTGTPGNRVTVGQAFIAGSWKTIVADIMVQGFGLVTALYFESTDCSGPPLVSSGLGTASSGSSAEAFGSSLAIEGAAARGSVYFLGTNNSVEVIAGDNVRVYYPVDLETIRTINSDSSVVASPQDCLGVFSAPNTCCTTEHRENVSLSPAQWVDLGTLTPPFRLDSP